MELWSALQTTGLTPTKLWLRLSPETRMDAAAALFEHDWEGEPVPTEANLHIAQALKFRPQAIRKLPRTDRIKYLARAVRPDRSLVSSLLLALHLEKRSHLMATFLDAVGIPHENGLIDEDYEFDVIDRDKVEKGVADLRKKHPEDQVDLYLVTLYMMDPKTWENLVEVMRVHLREGGAEDPADGSGASGAEPVEPAEAPKRAAPKKSTTKPAAKAAAKVDQAEKATAKKPAASKASKATKATKVAKTTKASKATKKAKSK